jgi:drug/metabolite transporter superfamily protein YnfA
MQELPTLHLVGFVLTWQVSDAGTAYASLGGVRVNMAGVRCRNCLPFAWWGSY